MLFRVLSTGELWNDIHCSDRRRALCRTFCALENNVTLGVENIDYNALLLPITGALIAVGIVVLALVAFNRFRMKSKRISINVENITVNDIAQSRHPNEKHAGGNRPSGLSLSTRAFWERSSGRTTKSMSLLPGKKRITVASKVKKLPWITGRPTSELQPGFVEETPQTFEDLSI